MPLGRVGRKFLQSGRLFALFLRAGRHVPLHQLRSLHW